MNQDTIIAAQGPLIPGSDIYEFYETDRLINNDGGKIYTNDIKISDNRISGIENVDSALSAVNKEYVINKFNINKFITYLDIGKDITYDVSYIYGGYINRSISQITTDTFPSITEIISYKQTNNISTNYFTCLVQNLSTDYNLNIILNTNTYTIEPLTNIIFYLLIIDDTEININFKKNYITNLSEYIYNYNNHLIINNLIRTTNNFYVNTNTYDIAISGLYQPNYVINSILTRTTIGGNDIFPSAINILSVLGILDTQTSSFNFLLRNATNNIITLSNNTGIIFNFTNPLTINIDTSVYFNVLYLGTNSTFQVNLLKITAFNNSCIIL